MMFGFKLPEIEYKCELCGQLWFSDELEDCPSCGLCKEEIVEVKNISKK